MGEKKCEFRLIKPLRWLAFFVRGNFVTKEGDPPKIYEMK